MKNPWTTVSEAIVYDNPWISVSHRNVITPTCTEGIYGLVHFKNTAVGIVPVDEFGNTWLVGQYRYALGQYSWEIPEGGSPIGDEWPLDSAKRELKEETGFTAASWTEIARLHTSNSVTDEFGLIYLAKGLSYGQAAPEDTEELSLRKLPFTRAVEMVHEGEITDAMSMVGLLRAARVIASDEV